MPTPGCKRPLNGSLDADVIVVGAGPSGCAAAYDLAARGVGVLLLDRTDFPRRKACAGGLTIKTIRALRYAVDPVIVNSARELSVSCRMHHPKILSGEDPICHFVERADFDRFCLQQTLAVGVEFKIVKRIVRIEEGDRFVSLSTNVGVIRAAYLIGADGVHSRVRRLTGRFPQIRSGFAVEASTEGCLPDGMRMGFDFSRIPGGYGWVFPKADHLNVGLYTQQAGIRLSRRHLSDYAADKLGDAVVTGIGGYPLGLGGWRYRPGRGRCLLVGDAAGMVDPLLGEGLYHAVVTGQLAAAAVWQALGSGDDACRRYADLLLPIRRELLFAQAAAAAFYRLPGAGHALLTSPAAGGPLMKGFARGLTLLTTFCLAYRFWLGMHLPDHSKSPLL